MDTPADVARALDLIAGGDYALVITNSVMQGPGGARLVAGMRRLYPDLPVLHLDDQSHPRVPEFPADVPTLHKPFGADVLLAKVEELLRGRA